MREWFVKIVQWRDGKWLVVDLDSGACIKCFDTFEECTDFLSINPQMINATPFLTGGE